MILKLTFRPSCHLQLALKERSIDAAEFMFKLYHINSKNATYKVIHYKQQTKFTLQNFKKRRDAYRCLLPTLI